MGFWELGIADPIIYNHSFRVRKIHETILNGAVAASSSSFTIDQPANAPIAKYIVGGNGGSNSNYVKNFLNKIVVGPSSHSSNVGAVEELYILSATGNTITTTSSCTYAYSDNDPITIYGTGCPDGWVFDSAMFSGGIIDNSYKGYDDLCGFSVPANSSALATRPYAELTLNKLIPDRKYNFGCWYRRATDGYSQYMSLNLYENGSSSASASLELSGGTSGWVEISTTFTANASQTANSFLRYLVPDIAGGGQFNQTTIDCIYLYTSWLEKGSSAEGKLVFMEIPTNIKIFPIEDYDKGLNKLLSGYSTKYSSPCEVLYNRRWGISCEFDMVNTTTDSSQSFFQVLFNYLSWQERGALLSLKTGLSELPPYLFGRMQLDNVHFASHNTGVRSFSFKFEGLI